MQRNIMSRLWQRLGHPQGGDYAPVAPASVPVGERAYAIGDIHGRLDLFGALIDAIDADDAQRGDARTTVVLLGDLIDRGSDSAGVVWLARKWSEWRTVRLLMGNHEEMFLDSFSKPGVLGSFLLFGGMETLASYGIDPVLLANGTDEELRQWMVETVPAEDRDFLAGGDKLLQIGGYLFVHAGVRPDMPLDRQTSQDCRWIREPFLSHRGDHGVTVVHGHTVRDEPELLPNRIGIDTGAYMTGTLTALGLEGTDRWLIQASEQDGAITCSTKAAAQPNDQPGGVAGIASGSL